MFIKLIFFFSWLQRQVQKECWRHKGAHLKDEKRGSFLLHHGPAQKPAGGTGNTGTTFHFLCQIWPKMKVLFWCEDDASLKQMYSCYFCILYTKIKLPVVTLNILLMLFLFIASSLLSPDQWTCWKQMMSWLNFWVRFPKQPPQANWPAVRDLRLQLSFSDRLDGCLLWDLQPLM